MSRPEPEIQTLIKRLTLGTKQGKVKWRAEHDQWFEFSQGDVTVMIRSDNPAGDEHPFYFQMSKNEAKTLARASSTEGEFYADWEDDLEELFKAARNQALGVDRAIMKLASDLDLPELPSSADDDIPF